MVILKIKQNFYIHKHIREDYLKKNKKFGQKPCKILTKKKMDDDERKKKKH